MSQKSTKEIVSAILIVFFVVYPKITVAQSIATTSVSISDCGDSLVTAPEECDVPGETGAYSTTIAGRQCNIECEFGPYCGDGILQTVYGEECDDANNTGNDFCSADCKIEPSGSGGGGSSGGGSRSGGSDVVLGDTQINVEGVAYPSRTLNIILDGDSVGSVRTNNEGEFEFAVAAEPGPATMGFWSVDAFGTRSVTYSTTFDVTQGAITNVRGILLPPTVKLSNQNINPGDILTISGQAPPGKTVQIYLDNQKVTETNSNNQGDWSIAFDTSGRQAKQYTVKANYLSGFGSLRSESSFSSLVSLFLGVEGQATRPSDLNRDTKVNLIDFSILIFWWGTNGGNSNPPADINANGRVGLEDFSILLFNWTG